MSTAKVAIVTGGTSGIGLAAALALHKKGLQVYVMARKLFEHEGLTFVQADVSDEKQVHKAVEFILSREGRIDILVNAAGFGISGTTEFTTTADARHLMDVNLYGVVHTIQSVLPVMRRQGSGRIVNISSVAAVLPIPYQTWYSVSKASVSAYSQALHNEVRSFGISVCAVMPGDTQTGFTDARKKSLAGEDVYGERIKRSVQKMEHDERSGMTAEQVGTFVAKIALRRNVKSQYTVGFMNRFLVVLARLLPWRVVSFGLGKLYSGE